MEGQDWPNSTLGTILLQEIVRWGIGFTRMALAVRVQHLSRTYNLRELDIFSCWKNASMGSLFSTNSVKSEKTTTDRVTLFFDVFVFGRQNKTAEFEHPASNLRISPACARRVDSGLRADALI